MKTFRTMMIAALACTIGVLPLAGCQSNEVHVKREYEYRGAGSPEKDQQQPANEEEDDSGEWKMTSPGRMVVDP